MLTQSKNVGIVTTLVLSATTVTEMPNVLDEDSCHLDWLILGLPPMIVFIIDNYCYN